MVGAEHFLVARMKTMCKFSAEMHDLYKRQVDKAGKKASWRSKQVQKICQLFCFHRYYVKQMSLCPFGAHYFVLS